jgi:MFS family permease
MTMAASVSLRRGWYHGWNIVAACVLSQAVANGLPVNAFSLFLHDWSTQLHAPISFFQLGLASLGLFSAFFSPIVGALADKYPARWLLGSGLAGIAIFYIGVSCVTSRWQLLVLFALVLPVSVALSTSLPANAVVARWFARRLGLALGLTAFGLGLAGVILPPVVAALLPAFGWRTIWRGGGLLIAFVVTPLVVWVVRDRPGLRDGTHYVTTDDAVVARGHGAGNGAVGLTWRDVLARRNFWLLVAAYLPMLALNGGCSNNLPPLAASRGLSAQTAGMLLSLFSLSYVGFSLIAGLLSDRFGNRVPLSGLAIATAVGGLIVAFGHDAASIGAGVLLVGASGGMWPLLAAAVAKEFGVSGVGRSFGLLLMFLPIIVLSPFFVAKTREITGSYVPALISLAALTTLGGVACLLFLRERSDGLGKDGAKA